MAAGAPAVECTGALLLQKAAQDLSWHFAPKLVTHS